jgi:hypothetical protein
MSVRIIMVQREIEARVQEHAGEKSGEQLKLHPPAEQAGNSQDWQGVKGVDQRLPATVMVGGCPDRFLRQALHQFGPCIKQDDRGIGNQCTKNNRDGGLSPLPGQY